MAENGQKGQITRIGNGLSKVRINGGKEVSGEICPQVNATNKVEQWLDYSQGRQFHGEKHRKTKTQSSKRAGKFKKVKDDYKALQDNSQLTYCRDAGLAYCPDVKRLGRLW